MANETLTRMDLAEAVFEEVGLSRNESADLVESVLQHISDALVRGENVKISSFGTFNIRDKNARIGRNPKTGEKIPAWWMFSPGSKQATSPALLRAPMIEISFEKEMKPSKIAACPAISAMAGA